MAPDEIFDVIVVGGGPAGATAAHDLAGRGLKVALLDRAGRIKPCGGAIPPRLIRDFDIPAHLLKARVSLATMVSPKGVSVDMPIDGGFVGMVDREEFDEWLRDRAAALRRDAGHGQIRVARARRRRPAARPFHAEGCEDASAEARPLKGRIVIGADGANSAIARTEVRGSKRGKFVFAYHEIIEAPVDKATGAPDNRCEIYYRGTLSPDFYAWIFPHGATMSVGSGSAHKGFSLKGSVQRTARRDRPRQTRNDPQPKALRFR